MYLVAAQVRPEARRAARSQTSHSAARQECAPALHRNQACAIAQACLRKDAGIAILLPIWATMIVGGPNLRRLVCAKLVQSLSGSGEAEKINEMSGLDRRFSIAPMMDWSEITIHSTRYETACAKIAHACSTFLSLSFSRKNCRSYESASGCTPRSQCGLIGPSASLLQDTKIILVAHFNQFERI